MRGTYWVASRAIYEINGNMEDGPEFLFYGAIVARNIAGFGSINLFFNNYGQTYYSSQSFAVRPIVEVNSKILDFN